MTPGAKYDLKRSCHCLFCTSPSDLERVLFQNTNCSEELALSPGRTPKPEQDGGVRLAEGILGVHGVICNDTKPDSCLESVYLRGWLLWTSIVRLLKGQDSSEKAQKKSREFWGRCGEF